MGGGSEPRISAQEGMESRVGRLFVPVRAYLPGVLVWQKRFSDQPQGTLTVSISYRFFYSFSCPSVFSSSRSHLVPAFFYYIQPSPGSTHLTVSDFITKRNKNRFSSTFPRGKVPGTALFTYCCCFVLSAARCFFNVVNLQKMSNSVAPRGHRGRRCCEPRETMQFACFIKATRGERLQWRLYCMNPESVGAICHSTLKPVTFFAISPFCAVHA